MRERGCVRASVCIFVCARVCERAGWLAFCSWKEMVKRGRVIREMDEGKESGEWANKPVAAGERTTSMTRAPCMCVRVRTDQIQGDLLLGASRE